ncbi:Nuclear envelope morphology protein 1 [Thecaphora frezii]
MNSISYLDSVLSRSFASDRTPDGPKRSRSYSSIHASREPATPSRSSFARPSTSHHRRGSRSRDSEPESSSTYHVPSSYSNKAKLRRTGSTSAGVSSAARLYDDDEDDDDDDDDIGDEGVVDGSATADHLPRARWSALWGLTGWLDEAINPSSSVPGTGVRRSGSVKAETASSAGIRQGRRVPSLDSLLLATTAPTRQTSRQTPHRTASSGASREEEPELPRRRSSGSLRNAGNHPKHRETLKRGRFGQAASLTMTNGASLDEPAQSQAAEADQSKSKEIYEKDAVGGDLFSEELSASPSHQGQSHNDRAGQDHRHDSEDSNPDSSAMCSFDDDRSQGQRLFGSSLSPTHAHEVASEGPVTGPSHFSALMPPNHDLMPSGSEPASLDAPPPYEEEDVPSPSISRRGSRRSSASRQGRSPPHEAEASDAASLTPSPSSGASSPTGNSFDGEGSPDGSTIRKRRKGVAKSSSKTEGQADAASASQSSSTGWLAARPPSPHSAAPSPFGSQVSGSSRRRRFSPTCAFHRALLALKDVLIAILMGPLRGIQLLTGRRRRRRGAKSLVQSASQTSTEVALLFREKSDVESIAATEDSGKLSYKDERDMVKKEGQRSSLSLRFAQRDALQKWPRSNKARPRTPRPEQAPADSLATAGERILVNDADADASSGASQEDESDDAEPVTEEQAAARAEKRGRSQLVRGDGGSGSGPVQRPPLTVIKSRLLPNPQLIDPMLAHDRKAEPIDEAMAREEARLQAEREAKVEERRAARRAARLDPSASGATPLVVAASSVSHAVAKVPRGPSSSVIHHTPKTLVLDLDETLIHSTSRSPTYLNGAGRRVSTGGGILGLESLGAVLGLRANENPGRIRPHMVEVVLDGRSVIYHVYKRPWVDYFLRKVASWYHVVVFTASVQEYADPVIDWLDQGRGLISGRLFREACTYRNGSYVKNLEVVDSDLSTVCLVDNSPASYAHNQANGIPIEGWTHDPNDEALLDLLPVLDSLRFATDVRHILGIRGFSSQ